MFFVISTLTKRITTSTLLVVILLAYGLMATQVSAAFNPEINYQGKLTNASGVAVPDGLYNINFWLVPTQGGATSTAIWSEARTSGNRVTVDNGLFSVMLGDVSSLAAVDFNQELYLAVEVGGISTTTPAWDGEMLPRKILGAVPAAFVAENANELGGVASSSFLRSDEADNLTATSTGSLLTLVQNGIGKVLSLFSGATEVFTVLNNGNVGIGTSTPSQRLSVGDTTGSQLLVTSSGVVTDGTWNGDAIGGAYGGTGLSTVTQNQLLIGGAGNTWSQVATSSLGLSAAFTTSAQLAALLSDETGTGLAVFGTSPTFTTQITAPLVVGGTTTAASLSLKSTSGVGASDYIRFLVGNNGATEAMRVTNSGYVGIGTTTPSSLLDVGGFSTTNYTMKTGTLGLQSYSLNNGLLGENSYYVNGDGWKRMTTGYASSIHLFQGQTMFNTADTGTGDFTQTLPLKATWSASGSVALGGDIDVYPNNFTGASMVVLGTGNVGIGTTTPSQRLSVGATTGSQFLVSSTGVVTDGTWSADTIAATRGGTGLSTITQNQLLIGGAGNTWSQVATSSLGLSAAFTTSAQLAALLSDEVGTGGGFVRASSTMLTSPNVVGATLSGTISGGTFSGGTWQGNAISSTYLDTAVILSTEIDTSSELITLVTDETGTGALVFAGSPTFTGTITAASSTLSGNLSVAGTSTLATTTASTLTIAGALRDSSASAGTLGMVLQTTGSGTQWVATSSLGFTAGATTFLGLTDTPSSYTASRIIYTNSGATALIDSADFTFDGNNLGLGSGDGLAINNVRVFSASTTKRNIGIGQSALFANLSNGAGDDNIAIGYQSLLNNGAGENNVAVGTDSLYNNTTGFDNAAYGYNSLYSNNSGSANAAFGTQVMLFNTIGTQNTAIGSQALYANTKGSYNTALGASAGYDIDTATSTGANTVIGYNTGRGIVTGVNNTVIGANVTGLSSSLSNNIIIADGAGNRRINVDSSGNVGLGTTTPGSKLTVAGDVALTNNLNLASTTGSSVGVVTVNGERFIHGYSKSGGNADNQFMGYQSGNFTLGSSTNSDLGFDNLGIGRDTLSLLTTGSYNTAVGMTALNNNTTGDYNAAVGRYTLVANTTGSINAALGAAALAANTTGSNNTAVGVFALQNADTSFNTAVGRSAGLNITSGGSNTILGYSTGLGITTGEYNTIIGANVTGLSSSLSNNIIIADGAGNRRINVDSSGNVGLGTTTPASRLTIAGDLFATGAFRDSSNASGTAGMVLQTTGSGTQWVATSTLGISGGGSLFTDGGATTYLTATGDNLGVGTTTAGSKLTVAGDIALTNNLNLVSYIGSAAGVVTVNGSRYIHDYTLDATNGRNQFMGLNSGNFTLGSSTNQDLGINNLGVGGSALANVTTGSANTAIGRLSLEGLTTGYGNTGGGFLSLNQNTTGSGNTAIGESAMWQTTTGQNNAALGAAAMGNNTTGENNSAFGNRAMLGNLDGSYNTAVGRQALSDNASGGNNTAVGYFALIAATSSNNTGIGAYAGSDITSGQSNTILGNYTGIGITTGSYNTIIGASVSGLAPSLSNNIIIADGQGNRRINVDSSGNVGIGTTTPGSKLTVVGDIFATGALRDSSASAGTSGMVLQTTGSGTQWVATSTLGITGGASTFLGLTDTPSSFTANRIMYTNAGATALIDSADFTYSGTDLGLGGDDGIAFGGTRYLSASTTNDSVTFGESAGATFADITTFNNAIGYQAGRYASTTAVDYNNFMGYQAGYNNTSSGSNIFGYQAGYNNAASNVVAIGYQAMGTTTGSNTDAGTIAIGYQALFNNTTGNANTAVGFASLQSNTTGGSNVAYGNNTLQYNTTGGINSAFGRYVLQDNTTGNSNSAFGSDALTNNITGNGNSAFGDNTLDANTTGISNSAFGLGALGGNVDGGSNAAFGHTALNALTTGNYNTALGYDAGATQTAGSNNLMIGYNAAVASTTGSNQMSIANLIYASGLGTGSAYVGIGTTTPGYKLTVVGDTYITGAFRDSSASSGTSGMVLQTTGSATQWTATSSLGLSASFTTSAQLAALLSDEVGTGGGFVRASSTMLTSPNVVGATLSGTISGGTFSGGTWQGNAISSTYLDTAVILSTEIDTSSELITLVTDETGTGALVFAGSPTFTGTITAASSTLSGNLSVAGTSTLGNTYISGALRDGVNSIGTAGMVLQTTGTSTRWVATSTLGIAAGSSLFTDAGATTYLTATGDNLGIGTTTADSKLTVEGDIALTNNLNLLRSTGSSVGVVALAGTRFIHDYTLDRTYGSNQFMGLNSGNFSLGSSTNQDLGINNLGVGAATLASLTTGSANTAIGPSSLESLTTGYGNTGVGFLSLYQNSSGSGNTAIGESSMWQNTTGQNNAALGGGSMGNNTTGSNNSAFGNRAMINNVDGGENTAMGRQALEGNVSGGNNTAVGYFALVSATSSNNTAVGAYAASDLISGQGNTILGNYTGIGITTGSYNTIIGASVTGLSSSLSNNIIIADGQGNRRINVDSSGNVGIGTTTPTSKLDIDTGSNTLGLRLRGLAEATELADIFVGATGKLVLSTANTGAADAFVEIDPEDDNYGLVIRDSSTGSTEYANLYFNNATTDYLNIVSGNTNGTAQLVVQTGGNVGVGTAAPSAQLEVYGTGQTTAALTDAGVVTAMLALNSSGTAAGSGGAITFGNTQSIAAGSVGFAAIKGLLTNGNNNSQGDIAFSTRNADSDSALTERMRIVSSGFIGIGTSSPAQKLQVVGDIRVGTTGTNGCVQRFDGTAISGTCSSDADLKTNITPLTNSTSSRTYLEGITSLTPVSYQWNEVAAELYRNGTTTRAVGLIAQDIELVFPELVSFDSKGYRQVDFAALPFYVMQAVKEFYAEFLELKDQVAGLAQRFVSEEVETGRLEVTGEICADGVCITAEQLRQLLQNQGGSNTGGSTPPAEDTPPADDGGSTEGGGETETPGGGEETPSETVPPEGGGGEVDNPTEEIPPEEPAEEAEPVAEEPAAEEPDLPTAAGESPTGEGG